MTNKAIKCSKCKKDLFYLPDGYTMDLKVECVNCHENIKPTKKKRTRRTAAGNYSRVKGGVRKDVHPTYYFRSPTEANFARLMTYLGIEWKFEERSFTFDGYKTKPFIYLMDFEITKIDGRKKVPEDFCLGWVEVKGYMNSASRNKLRRLKKNYPEDAAKTTVVIYTKYKKKDIEFCEKLGYKYMFYDELTKEYGDVVPGWE